MPTQIKIDKEFESLIPPLSQDEYSQLEQNIVSANKCRDALIAWDGILIDGHNRHKICTAHGVDFNVEEMAFNSREDAMLWIIRNQLGRRNLSAYDRSLLALRLKPVVKAQAEERMKSGKAIDPSQKSVQGKTDDIVAREADVSRDTIAKVEKIEREAPESVKMQVGAGKMSINRAHKELSENKPIPKAPAPKPGRGHAKTKQTSEEYILERLESYAHNFENLERDVMTPDVVENSSIAEKAESILTEYISKLNGLLEIVKARKIPDSWYGDEDDEEPTPAPEQTPTVIDGEVILRQAAVEIATKANEPKEVKKSPQEQIAEMKARKEAKQKEASA